MSKILNFIQSKFADGVITKTEAKLFEELLTEILLDESLIQAFQQEAESRLTESFETSMLSEGDTWDDYTIDEVDGMNFAPVVVELSNDSGFTRNSTVLPTLNEERYLDLGLLGKGGMGEVRKVRDTLLHRNIAIKVMDTRFSHAQPAIQRFIEEAQVGAQLQHPNIVPIHDFGRMSDGRYFFTMKEIQGRQFSELIRELHLVSNDLSEASSGLSLRFLIQIFHTVCETIAYAHSQKVIHRDLKPDNIMIGNFGEVLVVDWGIAKVLDSPSEGGLVQIERQVTGAKHTQFGMVSGTPAYMSPEQAMGRWDLVDERTDIYALGAILFEILNGSPAFIDDSTLDNFEENSNSLNTVSNDEAVQIREVPILDDETIPSELIHIYQKSMANDIQERFETVMQMGSEIWDWLEGERKYTQAMGVFQKSIQLFKQYQNAVEVENNLWEVANTLYSSHGFSVSITWKARDTYLQAKQDTKHFWEEYIALVDAALVFDKTLPEANFIRAELLIDSIISAVALGESTQLSQLEQQFQTHLKYVTDEEQLLLQNRLNSERGNSVTLLRLQCGDMIGRKEYLNNIITLVQDNPLVSLIGTKRVGKSRLVIEATHHLKQYVDVIYFCDLSTATTEHEMLIKIAESMGVELASLDPFGVVTNALANCKALIVLDHLDQILAQCTTVIDHWYEQCPQLRILTTARHRLGLPHERCIELMPLTEFEALEMFELHAKSVNPSFQVKEVNHAMVGRLIQDLDCMPHPIEQAASRMNILNWLNP